MEASWGGLAMVGRESHRARRIVMMVARTGAFVGRRVGWALLWLFFACPAFADTLVLDAELRGQPGSVSPDGDYELPGSTAQHVFVFDLGGVSDPIVAAKLVLPNPPGSFASPQRRETYAVFGVTDLEGHADAGAGARLGALEVNASSPSTLEIPLAASILRVLERTDGEVALGGRIETLKKRDGSERLFWGTQPGSGAPAPQLVLETDPGVTPAGAATLHVDDDADADEADGSAGAPFASIALALDLAAPGDEVQVAPGVYAEAVWLKGGVALSGSGPAETILDATELASSPVLRCAAGAQLAGFLVKDETPQLTLVDCAVATELTGNVFEAAGGSVVSVRGSGVWLHHNELRGTLSLAALDALVEDNVLTASEVALAVPPRDDEEVGAALVRRNVVRGVVSQEAPFPWACSFHTGGRTHLTLSSNVFLPPPGPPRAGSGGVVLMGCLRGDVLNNTFHDTNGVLIAEGGVVANNVLVHGAAGIQLEPGADAEIRDNDAFGNRAGFMGADTNYVGFEPSPGDGNVSVDPQLVDAFLEDFRLRPASPAVDAGAEDDDVESETDLDGDPRVVDGDDDDDEAVDLGAQEFQPDEVLPEPPLPIEVDVLPGRSPNELKFTKVSKGSGKVAVAILSDGALDAPADVDVATLILEHEPVLRCDARDIDHDGTRDLLCSFPLRGISTRGWPLAVPPACVRGETFAGRKLLGCDEVELVP
jgi:hypothetical protein